MSHTSIGGGEYAHVFAYCVPRKDHEEMRAIMSRLRRTYTRHGCLGMQLYVWGNTTIFQGFAGLREKLGATPDDELWLEIDSYKDEPHLRKVVRSLGKDETAPALWKELSGLVGTGRSIAMGEFERR